MKRALWGLLLLAVLVLTALPAFGAAPAAGSVSASDWPMTVTAEAGFEGQAKAGNWVPVTVTLRNDGKEFAGTIRFEVTATGGPGKHTGRYETPVVVPPGATKKVTVYVPTEMAGMPVIEVAAGQQVLAQLQPTLNFGNDALVGVLGVEPADLPKLAGHVIADGRGIRLVKLDPATIPSEAVALENLDAVLLDRFAISELPEPQRMALQAWVEHGGTLLVAGGPEIRRLEGLAPWVPLTVRGVGNVLLDGLGSAPLADADLTGWEPARRIGGQVVAARYRKGMGAVYLLRFDPALEPFASWTGLPDLMAGLIPGSGGFAGGGKGMPGPVGMKAHMVLLDTLTQFPMRELPSLKGLLLVLGAYALVIGPVHFLLLKGFRRVGWALLTLPLLAGAGGLGAWSFARTARAAEVLTNTVSVLEGQPGGSAIKVQSLTGFFVPPSSQHKVSIGDSLLMPLQAPYYVPGQMGGPPKEYELKSVLESGRAARFEPIDQWSMFAVSAQSAVPVAGTVTGALTVDTDRLTGQLTSRLPFRLEGALLVSATSFQKLGDLNPGDTAEVSLMQPAFGQNFGGDNPLAEVLARAQEFQGWMAGRQPTTEEFTAMRRQQISWAVSQAISWLYSANRPNTVVVGWTDWQALPVSVDGRVVKSGSLSLYVQPVDVAPGPGKFTLPASWLPARMVSTNGPVPFSTFHQGWSLGEGEAVTMEFTIPGSVLERVVEIEARLPAMARGPSGNYPLKLEFFRWSDGTWHTFTTNLDAASPPDDAAFVSPDGVVRVKATQTDRERVPLAMPGLMVTGRGVQP